MKNLKSTLIKSIIVILIILNGCSGDDPDSPQTIKYKASTSNFSAQVDAFIANDNSKYYNNIKECVYRNDFYTNESCSLKDLPLLGQEYESVTADTIIERLVITDDWMLDRFQEVLEILPDDILSLFKAVTAVVIATDVRPAFYWSSTGAIYLDPKYLWMTADEKNTIDQKEDYRKNYGNDLKFKMPYRYVVNNKQVTFSTDWDSNKDRTFEEMKTSLTHLLVHELAHANDFFPPTTINRISLNQSILSASNSIKGNRISDILRVSYPLKSQLLKDIAGINYRNETAKAEIFEYTSQIISEEFKNDLANDDYNYSTQYEDLAMFFEEFMMKYHFDIDRDFAVCDISNPDNITPLTGKNYIVYWGQRNRIGKSEIKEKAKLIVEYIFPFTYEKYNEFFNNLKKPTELIAGKTWSESILIGQEKGMKSQIQIMDTEVMFKIPYL